MGKSFFKRPKSQIPNSKFKGGIAGRRGWKDLIKKSLTFKYPKENKIASPGSIVKAKVKKIEEKVTKHIQKSY
jgi:hypothetical protein